jgi:signal transduction histidine kinase
MRIAHRLYLTVVPAIVGVLAVAALAYWGQYERRVPTLVLIVAVIAAVGTLVLGWLNARYIAQRVERLARAESAPAPAPASAVSLRGIASAVVPGHVGARPDELDAIESVVDRLNDAVAVAESDKAHLEREASDRARDFATHMATVAEDVVKRIEEIRLPLHILLENRFGELNENQEEMLGAARAAADAADADIIALRQLADLDRGARTLRRDRILPGDLVKALVPTLQAQAEKQGTTLHVDVEPLVPAIRGDQPQLQEALATLLGEALATAGKGEMEVRLSKTDKGCAVTAKGGGDVPRTVRTALAIRIIAMTGGRVDQGHGQLTVRL